MHLEELQDVFWTSYVRSIYILCPGAGFNSSTFVGYRFFVKIEFNNISWGFGGRSKLPNGMKAYAETVCKRSMTEIIKNDFNLIVEYPSLLVAVIQKKFSA